MKKFIDEYKYRALRSKSETETSDLIKTRKDGNKVASTQDMGVFKWLRRERWTVSSHSEAASEPADGTIRTEQYKRDLAEFQARRMLDPPSPRPTRRSLPASCADCTRPASRDDTFNYERKTPAKYKKHKRTSSTDTREGLPNIQFLFQNQVFMPGNLFPTAFSEPPKCTRSPRRRSSKWSDEESTVQRQIDFDEQQSSPHLFAKSSPPRYGVCSSECEEVDAPRALRNNAGTGRSEASGAVTGEGSSQEDTVRGSDERLWEALSELKHLDQWADEQLQLQTTKSDDSKSDTSAYGLPVASPSELDVSGAGPAPWSRGRWGAVPVQVKRLPGVTVEDVRRRTNTEINILRKYRHPNIILLMGVSTASAGAVRLICERCVDSLHTILHAQGRILTAQTSVHYALDIASALVFLRMQGYLHTALNSTSVMVTGHGAAKLAELGACVRLGRPVRRRPKGYEVYSPEPQYVNIEESRSEANTLDSVPLISKHPSELYLASQSVAKPYKAYSDSEYYQWQAPELFEPDPDGMVHPCAKSDVYSLCLVLWECCNASIPWPSVTYEKLKESYVSWKTGLRLPQDGTYPGSLLALLQSGLKTDRAERVDLTTLQTTLQDVKRNIDELDYIIIPARLPQTKSTFSSVAWDNAPTDESDCQSPIANGQHNAIVHEGRGSSTETSENDSKSDASPQYETIHQSQYATFDVPEKCYLSDDERPVLKYEHLPEKEYSSACSTPIAKIRARIRDVPTPGSLHRSDSTEYCSILSPDQRNLGLSIDASEERPTAKLSRSFTPKSYKPLHIKVPECNLDSVKSILKDQSSAEKSSYNFDIKNYSLPTTPIARSNKLRKNAWLSGDLSAVERTAAKRRASITSKTDCNKARSAPETPVVSTGTSPEKEQEECNFTANLPTLEEQDSTSSSNTLRKSAPAAFPERPPAPFPPTPPAPAPSPRRSEEDVLAKVNVKPLVAIHERWIYEANRKTGRSMSLPDDNRCHISAVKPASHCVDTLQKSLPQLAAKRPGPKPFRGHPVSPNNGAHWDNFCQARDTISKSVNFATRDPDRFQTWKKQTEKGVVTDEIRNDTKIDQSTDTWAIEEFIKELIRKEFQHLLNEMSDDVSSTGAPKNEELLNRGVANIIENLKNGDDHSESSKKEPIKSFSKVKINGNNKPLLQITFSRTGENSLQVLDNCVNVTLSDSNLGGKDKINLSLEDTLTEEVQVHGLKRCQAFNAIQEARSTEDLYIDDDLSTQMQENFGGRVKLIPLHGSLHEILCEKEDDCCLIKVKQENGCDTIYFKCDNSDTESRDAIDGCDGRQDTVVFKRSISLVEERIQRIFPKDKRSLRARPRPKSEVFTALSREARVLSSSTPALNTLPVEVNIESAACYQDSSSDECLRCQSDAEEFELLERKIEDDLSRSLSSITCGCLHKISEENLSALNDDDAK